MKARRVLIVGQGYVGLPLAMRAVAIGDDVVGFDVAERRVASLSAGTSHVADVSDAEVAEALATGRYRPTSDAGSLQPFDVAVITVPTPLTDGVPISSTSTKPRTCSAPWSGRGAWSSWNRPPIPGRPTSG